MKPCICHQCHKIKNSKKINDTFCNELAPISTKKSSKNIRIFITKNNRIMNIFQKKIFE
jgi:hypothetical protein